MRRIGVLETPNCFMRSASLAPLIQASMTSSSRPSSFVGRPVLATKESFDTFRTFSRDGIVQSATSRRAATGSGERSSTLIWWGGRGRAGWQN